MATGSLLGVRLLTITSEEAILPRRDQSPSIRPMMESASSSAYLQLNTKGAYRR